MELTAQDAALIKKAAEVIRAIKNPLRQKIYNFCQEEKSVTAIYVHFKIEQSWASQHLAIMKAAGWLKATRRGKEIYYSVTSQNNDRLNYLKALTA